MTFRVLAGNGCYYVVEDKTGRAVSTYPFDRSTIWEARALRCAEQDMKARNGFVHALEGPPKR